MKRTLYVLCLLTLAAVVLDIALFHSRSANAQAVPGVRLDRIIWNHTTNEKSITIPTLGHIVGFQCVKTNGGVPECFVASSSN
jgi:hypothetical protein